MQTFRYSALDSKGDQTSGSIKATNESDAIQKLRSLALYPTQIEVSAKQVPANGKASAIKCVGSSIVGGIAGFVVFLVGWVALKIVVGLIFWNAELGTTVASFAILAIPAGLIIGFIAPINAYEKAKRAAEEAEQQRLAAEAAARDAECRKLALILDSSKSTFLSLDKLVNSADGWLDTAEHEFKERAFAPFWDALEHATNFLGAYHESVGKIMETASEYERRRSRLSVTVPTFEVPESGIPDARPIASRLSQLGRNAQKDFQFATIYEQRKTNQLLNSGFRTLAEGLERMQYAITDALDNLSLSLGTRLDDLLAASTSQAEAFGAFSHATASHFEAAASHYQASDDESKKQTEMLDNIQRGHKPL